MLVTEYVFFVYIQDLYSGLLGPLVICRPGTLQGTNLPDRKRSDVAREFALLFLVHDENQSWYLDENIRTYLGVDPNNFFKDEDFEESNMMHGKRRGSRGENFFTSCPFKGQKVKSKLQFF